MGVCEPLCCAVCFLFPPPPHFKEGTCSDEGLTAPGYICPSVWALHSVSPSFCVSASVFVSALQSSPQNRPLIIVWCVSGSAVGSYKERLGVFIADRQKGRLELRWQANGGRSQRRGPETFPASNRHPSSPFTSTLCGSAAWL